MDEHPEIKQEILDISSSLDDDYDIEFDVPEYINIKTQIPIDQTLIVASENKKKTTSKLNKSTLKDVTEKIKKELNDEQKLKPKKRKYAPNPKTCDICGQQLSCTKSLKLHMRIHNDEKPYKCEICGKLFRQKSGLTSHMVTHSKEKPFPCPNCDGSFTTSSSLKRHIRRIHDSGKTFDCRLCPESFYNMMSFLAHRKEKHVGVWEPRKCPDCGIMLVNQRMSSKHFRIAHLRQSMKQPTNNKCCILCGKEFETIKLYIEHKHNHLQYTQEELRTFGIEKIYPCKICNGQFSSLSNIVGHIATHMEKTHECKSCNELFSFYMYKNHMKQIHDEVTCQICKEVLLGKRAIRIHKAQKHYSRNQCRICKKVLSSKSALIIHTKTIHGTEVENTNQKQECLYCHAVFVKKGILHRHILRFHVNMLKKSCDICNIKFDYYYELSRHIQSQHAKLFKKRRQHQCNLCNKSYYEYASLRSHKTRKHRNKKQTQIIDVTVKCNQCSKEFLNDKNFKRHLLVHSVKDRTCRFCHYDFKNKDSLKEHFLEEHPDEKTYCCDYCNIQFSTHKEMMKHRKLQSHKKKFRSFSRFHWQLFMKPTDFEDCNNPEHLDEVKPQILSS